MNVTIEESWKERLSQEFEKPYFPKLTEFVKSEYQTHRGRIFPKGSEIFSAFDACPFDQIRVVILGQDPYPTRGHANGLCFSVNDHVKPFPKSLNNIFKELKDDLGVDIPQTGNLERWAKQGVLLLNSSLTVREGSPESHAGKGWELFTDAVISQIAENREGVVFLLWGSKAQRKAECVNGQKHYILKSPHPSPLSAHRGFFGCKHFSKANTYLKERGEAEIVW